MTKQEYFRNFLKTHAAALTCIFLVTFYFAFQVRSIEDLRRSHPHFSDNDWKAFPNNGKIATAFAVNIHPYYIFSEDFHLYFLRARRIARFGFVNDILEPSRSSGVDFRNPVQVLVCLPMALWGHKLSVYSFFISVYLSLAYVITYAINYRLFKNSAFALLCSLAVFVALGYRGLRVSTYLLSVPALIAGLSLLISKFRIIGKKRLAISDLLPVTIILGILGLWDVWSFLFLFFIFLVFGGCFVFIQSRAAGPEWFKSVISAVRMFSIAMIPVAAAVFINKPAHQDLLNRAGFFVSTVVDLSHIEPVNVLKGVLLCISAIFLFRGIRGIFFAVTAFLFLGFVALVLFSIFFLRMEPHALSHFYFISHAVWMWWLWVIVFWPETPVLWDNLKKKKMFLAVEGGILNPILLQRVLFTVCFLLFLYIGIRFYHFSPEKRYPEFAIPHKYEELAEHLQANVKVQKGKSLLTLSHELNLLLAYHTDFDLLLPEGFPLYSTRTNQQIFDRMAAVSRFFGVSPMVWAVFLKQGIPNAQSVWVISRELSESVNYLYYLFHRYGIDQRFAPGREEQSLLLKHRLCEEVLNNPAVLAEPPDFVVSEGMYKVLGLRPPIGYDLVFQSEDVALYQKKG